MLARGLLMALCWPGMLPGPTRDFLTAEEIDQVRAAQEPNLRVQLYLKFAQQRIAQLNQLLSRERAGSTALVHDLLEDYTGIIEALDTVADDALRRKVDIARRHGDCGSRRTRTVDATQEGGRRRCPSDMARYEFVLKDAIDVTEDSIELSDDLSERSREISAKDQKQDEVREEGLAPGGRQAAGGSQSQAREADQESSHAATARRSAAATKSK